MELRELIQALANGEDSKHQFKLTFTHADAIAREMAAFSNSRGGFIFIGAQDDGTVSGLSTEEIGKINNLISNAASEGVRPPLIPFTEILDHPNGKVLVVEISQGSNKPYMDKDGVIWIKCGADKRKAISREEIQRMFQQSGLIHGDEIPTSMTVGEIDEKYFWELFRHIYGSQFEERNLPLSQILENLNLAKGGLLNVAGALLIGKNVEYKLPSFTVKAVSWPGRDVTGYEYNDSEDINGKIYEQFQKCMGFLTRNLKHSQQKQSVNSTGILEIPRLVLEELTVNALVHRDFFVQDTVKLFVFDDRVELISPGTLPNNLTIENIHCGNSNIRNPILASFASRILPYRGLGSGILRSLQAWPHIDFIDDRDANRFIVKIWRNKNAG